MNVALLHQTKRKTSDFDLNRELPISIGMKAIFVADIASKHFFFDVGSVRHFRQTTCIFCCTLFHRTENNTKQQKKWNWNFWLGFEESREKKHEQQFCR